MRRHNYLIIFFLIFITFPIWSLLFNSGFASVDLIALWPVLKFTALQATLSSVFSLVIGLFLATSLLNTQSKSVQNIIQVLFLVPVSIPVIVWVSAFYQLGDVFKFDVGGLWAIIGAHTLIYSGLIATQFQRVIEDRLGGLSEICLTLNVGTLKYYGKIFFPLLKYEIGKILLFSFIIFFTSFTIPYFFSGSLQPTVELYILKLIQIDGEWGQGLTLCLLQVLFVMGFMLFMKSGTGSIQGRLFCWRVLKTSKFKYLFVTLFVGILAFAFSQVYQGWATFNMHPLLLEQLSGQILYSTGIAVLLYFVTYLLLCYLAYCFPRGWQRVVMYSYMAPSSVIVAFSLLKLAGTDLLLISFVIVLGLLFLLVPSLYRLQLGQKLEALEAQIEVAEVLGVSRWKTFKRIIWPQTYESIIFLSALSAFWGFGDFAISVILAPSEFTLPLMLKSLLGSYRVELANLYSLLTLFLGLIVFVILWKGSDVVHKKYLS